MQSSQHSIHYEQPNVTIPARQAIVRFRAQYAEGYCGTGKTRMVCQLIASLSADMFHQ